MRFRFIGSVGLAVVGLGLSTCGDTATHPVDEGRGTDAASESPAWGALKERLESRKPTTEGAAARPAPTVYPHGTVPRELAQDARVPPETGAVAGAGVPPVEDPYAG